MLDKVKHKCYNKYIKQRKEVFKMLKNKTIYIVKVYKLVAETMKKL